MKVNKIFMLGMMTLSLAACSDIDDEVTSINNPRLFSPTSMETEGTSENSVTIKWNPSEGAISYTARVYADDSLKFAETALVQTITDIETSSVKIENLVYDTDYSVQVMAVGNGEKADSKWHGIYFHTDAQQIFYTPEEWQISDRDLILTWPAGETVTKIVILNEAGTILQEVELTAEDIQSGKILIEGLEPETKYTAVLLNGEKERGRLTATTIADLAGAIIVRPTDDLKAKIEAAEANATLALYGGTYPTNELDDEGKPKAITLGKKITIKGIYPTNPPVIQARFEITDGAEVTLNNLKFDGSMNSDCKLFDFKTAGVAYGNFLVENCEIYGTYTDIADNDSYNGYDKGVFYFNVASTIESIVFNKCLIYNIQCDGGDLFDARKGQIKVFSILNSTIYNSAFNRDFIRIDKNSGGYTDDTEINVMNNTIHNTQNAAAGKRFLYVRFKPAVINMESNIISTSKAIFSNQSATVVPTFKNNVYHEADAFLTAVEKDGNLFTDPNANVNDPKFVDAAGGDFHMNNEALIKLAVGDPRWLE